MPSMTGRVIAGRYNLQTPIGRGAMGVVWRAHDRLLDREVAVKEVVISALIGADERRNAYQRTLREARTAARLSHRGVVAIYDVAEEDGRPWIIMELVPSQSLDQLLVVEGRLAAGRAGRIGVQLLSALAAAHVAGVLHRDVKPSNVLIASSKGADGLDERAVLTDFGIAQFEGDPRLTQTGMVMGSPGFTAPERIRGSDATPASDLWSLGATIYAALEGRGPYENRGGAITTMSAIINEDAPVAPHAGPLAPVIAALLRRDPVTRPSAATASRLFARALQQLTAPAEELPGPAHPPTVGSAAYVPRPAAPMASAPVTAPDAQRDEQPSAVEEPATEEPAGEEAAQEAPAAEAVGEAAEVVSAEPDSANAAEAEAEPESEVEPAAELVPAAAAVAEAQPTAQPEAASAAETARFQSSALESLPVPGAPAADDQAAKPKVAAAADAKDNDAVFRAPDTVVPRKGAVPPPPPVPEAKPDGPKPTFTAVSPTERPVPSFSATKAPRPVPPRPGPPATPPASSQHPVYGQGGQGGHGNAGPGYQPPGRVGPTAYPQSGAQYQPAGAGARYPGPAQPTPDITKRYAPGSGGGAANRNGGGYRRQLIWLVVAVIVAAAIGVGAALALSSKNGGSGNRANAASAKSASVLPSVADTKTGLTSVDSLNNPSTALPAGWKAWTVTQADAKSAAAGFSIDTPPGWTEKRGGLQTDFVGPGGQLLEVDLTRQGTSNMLTAADKNASINRFPGYKQLNLQAEPVRNTEGALWKFSWTPAGGRPNTADDIFFAQATSGGVQDYAIYIRSPSSTFSSTSLPLFGKMLQTFQTAS